MNETSPESNNTSGFPDDLSENARVAGFHRKIAAHVTEYGTFKEKNGRWFAKIDVGLDGKKLSKPIKAESESRKEVVDSVTKELLLAVKAKTTPGALVMVPVTSSNIAAIGYDEKKKALYIRFKSGPTWEYMGVPTQKARDLMNAGSHGSYFANFIKGAYLETKISG